MFNATCLIKTDIDTVNKCMGQNPYNPETFLQNFASRLTSFNDPLLNMYPTSEIAGNIEDEDVILGLREPQKLIEWAKTMKERTQCMAMAEFSAALQKHKAEGIDITKPMYTCLRSIEMDSNESYLLRYAAELFDNHPNPECGELFYDGEHWHQVHCIDDILDEYDDDIDNALDALYSIEAHGDIDGDYWCTTTDKDLNRTIRECRTEILVDALLARGSEAVEEFLGYPVNMSEAECVLEEYLNNLSDEDLANAFFETL